MDIFTIILIAIGLAMDCFAVSISKGICSRKFYFSYVLRMALLFGIFQAGMPLIGYFISSYFAEQIKVIDHWIAFILLGFVGAKMLVEAFEKKEEEHEEECSDKKHYKWKGLLTLAFATSIDALATGVILAPFPEFIWIAILIIGLTSFVLSIVGVIIGVLCGKRFNFKVEALGGIILIGIGVKILVEHLFFS